MDISLFLYAHTRTPGVEASSKETFDIAMVVIIYPMFVCMDPSMGSSEDGGALLAQFGLGLPWPPRTVLFSVVLHCLFCFSHGFCGPVLPLW